MKFEITPGADGLFELRISYPCGVGEATYHCPVLFRDADIATLRDEADRVAFHLASAAAPPRPSRHVLAMLYDCLPQGGEITIRRPGA